MTEFSSLADVEIKWNPFDLPNKGLYSVQNSRLAEEYLYRYWETKHPDFRVRVVWDHESSTVEIGSRVSVWAEEVKRILRVFDLKEIRWKPNTVLKRMREKQYAEIK